MPFLRTTTQRVSVVFLCVCIQLHFFTAQILYFLCIIHPKRHHVQTISRQTPRYTVALSRCCAPYTTRFVDICVTRCFRLSNRLQILNTTPLDELHQVERAVDEYRNVIDSVFLQYKEDSRIKQLPYNQSDIDQSRERLREHKHACRDFQSELNHILVSAGKSSLLDGAKQQHQQSLGQHASRDEMMSHGLQVMNASHISLKRSLDNVMAARELGVHVVTELENQNAQTNQLHDHVVAVDTTMSRTMTALRRIRRRLSTDRVIWACACLITIATVVLIVILQLRDVDDSNNKSHQDTKISIYQAQRFDMFVLSSSVMFLC